MRSSKRKGKNICLIILSNIDNAELLTHLTIKLSGERGLAFNFQDFFPLEPKTAFTYVLRGCNPGKVGFLDITDNPFQFKQSKGFEHTVLSVLQQKRFTIEYSLNNIPNKNADFSFIYLNDIQLLDNVLDIFLKKGAYVFIAAPVCEKNVRKAVNINSFLKEKEIIETNTEGEIIWANSLAYQKGYGNLWINLIGRDPDGSVSPGDEYEEVREALIKGITEKIVDDESNQAVVERVYKKEELFNGENLVKMPDLIVTLKQGFGFSHAGEEPIFNTYSVMKKECKAYIAGRGILFGESINEGQELNNVAISSIATSILYCGGCAIPAWMEGQVEERFFSKGFISGNPPKYEDQEESSTLLKEDEDLIKERLRGLGYIE